MTNNKVLLSANNITIRLRDHFLFHNTSWELKEGEQWLIIGENGSGKTTFAKALAGLFPLKTGEIILHFVDGDYKYPQLHKDQIAYLSFDTQQQFLKRDSLQRDFDSYVGIESPGTKVRDFLFEGKSNSVIPDLIRNPLKGKQEILKQVQNDNKNKSGTFNLSNLLDRDMITLSTGEMRKVFLIKSIRQLGGQKQKILILDEPFDGLDLASKKVLKEIISLLMKNGMQIILIVHKKDQIPKEITHVMEIKDGRIEKQGEKINFQFSIIQPKADRPLDGNFQSNPNNQLSNMSRHSGEERSVDSRIPFESERDSGQARITKGKLLIDMQNVTVKYSDKIILDNLTWQVQDGENWAILGHNGAGKSTLLQLIIGEQLQKFSNNIVLFGKKKEELSIWDIKKEIGLVSQDILIKHVYDIKVESVILSGFFDSIGLYKTATESQKLKAKEWINILGLQDLVNKNFQELSYGQKRLILIARAVVKSPKILILDEPCHGLDSQNRQKVLSLIDEVGSTSTNLLLVTHDPSEIVQSITNVLELENGRIVKKTNL